MSKAKEKDTVLVHYTGKLTTGEIFDTSIDREPLEFTIGSGQLIQGFDRGVLGMSISESRTVTIPSEEAYGPVNDQLIQRVDADQIPPEISPVVGQTLVATDSKGEETHLIVREVNEAFIIVDANHPLAGQDLIFDITLVAIQK